VRTQHGTQEVHHLGPASDVVRNSKRTRFGMSVILNSISSGLYSREDADAMVNRAASGEDSHFGKNHPSLRLAGEDAALIPARTGSGEAATG
jgi:hypothetical protein